MERTQRWSCQVSPKTAELYKQYFREHGIYFEPSEFLDLVHISFEMTETEVKKLTKWLNRQLYF
jgi:hypothetical protein